MNRTVRRINPCKMYMTTKPAVLFDSIQAFSFAKRFTDLNSSESRKNSSSSIVLLSRLKRSNSRIFLNEAIIVVYLLGRRAETGACFPALDDVLDPSFEQLCF